MRVLYTYLLITLLYLGVAPSQVVCTGETHDPHLVDGEGHNHTEHESDHSHHDGDDHLCEESSREPEHGCPETDCVDVELRLDATIAENNLTARTVQGVIGLIPDAPVVLCASLPEGSAQADVAIPPPLPDPLDRSCRLTI